MAMSQISGAMSNAVDRRFAAVEGARAGKHEAIAQAGSLCSPLRSRTRRGSRRARTEARTISRRADSRAPPQQRIRVLVAPPGEHQQGAEDRGDEHRDHRKRRDVKHSPSPETEPSGMDGRPTRAYSCPEKRCRSVNAVRQVRVSGLQRRKTKRARRGAPLVSAKSRTISAWRTGTSGAPWPCRTSCARPRGCRA